MRIKFIVSAIVLSCSIYPIIGSCAQVNTDFDSLIYQIKEKYNLPGLAVGVVKDGNILFQRGYGYSDIEKKLPVNESSVFHTASVSKLFTAQAIIALVETNKLTLETTIGSLNLDIKYKNPEVLKITIRQLLDHSSGLPHLKSYNWKRNNTDSFSVENYFKKKSLSLKNTPGTFYRYSNLGYDLLALIIQKVSGTSFEEFVKKQVLLKGNMIVSDYRHFMIPTEFAVKPHTKSWTGRTKVRKVFPYTREHAGSSTLNANIRELNNWMISFINGESYKKYATPSPSNFRMGIGFQLYKFNNSNLIGHYGGDKGFRSFLLIDPIMKIGIVVLSNSDSNEDFRDDLVFSLYKKLIN